MRKKGFVLGIFLLAVLVVLLFLILRDNPNLNFTNSDANEIPDENSQVHDDDSGTNSNPPPSSNNSSPPPSNTPPPAPYVIQKTSLTEEERNKVRGAILSSEFIGDLPNDGIVSLQFFNFENGQRVWLDKFLIGKNQILISGTPDILITLHYKYIAELTNNNLCEIIPKANANGDLGTYSDLSDTKLFLKYSGVIKYRSCFGI
jgi:hypothetical protein